ncbi:hypothetical protein F0562_020212 [Nyssa sinensis]|uniref:Helicase ATP-binding domain-containing protein n=1 Tax=Nyssa sinensis TaxID=561372 RepID=A0A5J5BRD1_9ASTE|nr:hypothetical protein F0562_020212 [Nyssa sinensis]
MANVMTTVIWRSMQYKGSEVVREVAWIIFDECPNAKEFADWVAKVHRQPCHIVYTDYRPTVLQHYIFPSGGNGDRKRESGKWRKGLILGRAGEESDIFKMVKMIIQRQYDPVILFSFSKRECEFLAMQMAKMDLNEDDEKVNIETIFWSAMDMLSDDDKKLPQVSNMLPLLKRGIGVHHYGLLPTLKEVIEILFQEGLIKCLLQQRLSA